MTLQPALKPVDRSAGPVIVLFRHDLRTSDNPALAAAAQTGRPVVPLFVLDDEPTHMRPLGAARRWWLHHSLASLADALASLGSPLVLRRGRTEAAVVPLAAETGAAAVCWTTLDGQRGADVALARALEGAGVAAESFQAGLLHDPWRLATRAGTPFRTFTPFWRTLREQAETADAVDPPERLKPPARPPASEPLADWGLLPRAPDWAAGFAAAWRPGEDGARAALRTFIDEHLAGYAVRRDFPAAATSFLSPHLANGEITPALVFAVLRDARRRAQSADFEKFRQELGWRDFCWHLLAHNPGMADTNLQHAYDRFPWRRDPVSFRRWRKGLTGYPIVDAGMRQLWQTGWMHNRVRMIAASFLIKHLLIDWRLGEKWFWDTLVDADPANNPAGWQWVAGSGADAAPFFRIFNPVLQGERYDASGAYVRRWVPELARLPDRYLHRPWEAPAGVLFEAGVKLGATYPVPVVDHESARQRALSAFATVRGQHDSRSVQSEP